MKVNGYGMIISVIKLATICLCINSGKFLKCKNLYEFDHLRGTLSKIPRNDKVIIK